MTHVYFFKSYKAVKEWHLETTKVPLKLSFLDKNRTTAMQRSLRIHSEQKLFWFVFESIYNSKKLHSVQLYTFT